MKTTCIPNLIAAALVGALAATSAYAQTVETRIGKLDFEIGVKQPKNNRLDRDSFTNED